MLFKISQNSVGTLGQNKCTKSCVEIFYINLHLVKISRYLYLFKVVGFIRVKPLLKKATVYL